MGGAIYGGGGGEGGDCRVGTTGLFDRYDPVNDAWASRKPMITPRSSVAFGVIGGKLYVVGGSDPCPPCDPLASLEVYDPAPDSWAAARSMPTPRRGLGPAALRRTQLHVVGRSTGSRPHTPP